MDIESGEVKLILDEDGHCIDVKKRTSGESEAMIEEFMLLANQCAAHFARVKQIPFVYRVHEEPNAEKLDAIDSAMLQAFGNRYINVRKYLMVDGMTDAGLTASKAEQLLIQQGRVPTSFRSNASGADLNGTAYKLIGRLVYDRMDTLGYFDEIRQELGLDKTTQEILKSNPKYFETILNVK